MSVKIVFYPESLTGTAQPAASSPAGSVEGVRVSDQFLGMLGDPNPEVGVAARRIALDMLATRLGEGAWPDNTVKVEVVASNIHIAAGAASELVEGIGRDSRFSRAHVTARVRVAPHRSGRRTI